MRHLYNACRRFKSNNFNPRTREGCDTVAYPSPSVWLYFNPRTREGWDDFERLDKGGLGYISIHAPAKGATYMALSQGTITEKFQSTHPRRVRLMPTNLGFSVKAFQSTHPRRVRPTTPSAGITMLRFQSTHPRRVRPEVD